MTADGEQEAPSMNVLIVYGTTYGTTEHLAHVLGSVLEPHHSVRVIHADEAGNLTADGVDLLMVGAPTQWHGLRLIIRPFLRGLAGHGFSGVAAVAFDTRGAGPKELTGSEADLISRHLRTAGCRLVAQPESFVVADAKGPLALGEEERARAWAARIVEAAAIVV
jgi:flavodoxin